MSAINSSLFSRPSNNPSRSVIDSSLETLFSWINPDLNGLIGSTSLAPSINSSTALTGQARQLLSLAQQQLQLLARGSPQHTTLLNTTSALDKALTAKEMSQFSMDSFKSAAEHDPRTIPNGARRLSDADLKQLLGISESALTNPSTGFAATIYRNHDNKWVIAFRGSDDNADWITNITSVLGARTPQYQYADELTKRLAARVGNANVEVTGISLGGGLANYAALKNNVRSITFNPKGTTVGERREIPDMDSKARYLIDNYHVDGEPLTGLQSVSSSSSSAGLGGLGLLGAPGNRHTLPAVKRTSSNAQDNLVQRLIGQIQPFANLTDSLARHGGFYVMRGVDAVLNDKNQAVANALSTGSWA